MTIIKCIESRATKIKEITSSLSEKYPEIEELGEIEEMATGILLNIDVLELKRR